jgi:hypothetical protein
MELWPNNNVSLREIMEGRDGEARKIYESLSGVK